MSSMPGGEGHNSAACQPNWQVHGASEKQDALRTYTCAASYYNMLMILVAIQLTNAGCIAAANAGAACFAISQGSNNTAGGSGNRSQTTSSLDCGTVASRISCATHCLERRVTN